MINIKIDAMSFISSAVLVGCIEERYPQRYIAILTRWSQSGWLKLKHICFKSGFYENILRVIAWLITSDNAFL